MTNPSVTRGRQTTESGGQQRYGGDTTLAGDRKCSILERDREPIPIPNSEEEAQAQYEVVLEKSLHGHRIAYPNILMDVNDIKGA